MNIFYEAELHSTSSSKLSKKAVVSHFYFHESFEKELIFHKNRKTWMRHRPAKPS